MTRNLAFTLGIVFEWEEIDVLCATAFK